MQLSFRQTILGLTVAIALCGGTVETARAAPRAFSEGSVDRALQQIFDGKRAVKPAARNVLVKKGATWLLQGAAGWALDNMLDYLWENGLPSAGNPSFACAKAGICN